MSQVRKFSAAEAESLAEAIMTEIRVIQAGTSPAPAEVGVGASPPATTPARLDAIDSIYPSPVATHAKKMKFLKAEYGAQTADTAKNKTRSFALDKSAFRELCDRNPEIAQWATILLDEHSGRKQHRKRTTIIFALHWVGDMTCVVAYPLGKRDPISYALNALLEVRGDKNYLGNITQPHDLPFKWSLLREISARRECQYSDDSAIGISLFNDKITIELPHPSIWQHAGLDWLWHSYQCCEANWRNRTPWAGRACTCNRPY